VCVSVYTYINYYIIYTYASSYYLLLRTISTHERRSTYIFLFNNRSYIILHYYYYVSARRRVSVCTTVLFDYLIVINESECDVYACVTDVMKRAMQLYILLFFFLLILGCDCNIIMVRGSSDDDRNEINWTRRTGCVREMKRGKGLMVVFIKYIVVAYYNNKNMTAYSSSIYVCI
jgi:hypothetical protein